MVVVALGVVACGALPGASEPAQRPLAAPLVWPKPPVTERIRFVQCVSGPEDWQITRTWLQRLFDTLSGQGKVLFERPGAVIERASVLVVADPGAQAVWILDAPQNRYLRLARVGQWGLLSPVALALGPGQSFYLADTVLKRVFQIDRDGSLLRTISTQGMERPSGLAWDDARHRLYVLDSKRERISVFDGNGALLQHLGESGANPAQFNHPTHLALDGGATGGNLLVTDAMNFRIQSFEATGKFLWTFGQNGNGSGDLAAPKGVASDSDENIYVADALFDAVQIFNRQGRLLLAFGESGAQPGQFAMPRGLFISSEHKIYVADAYNKRVQIFLDAAAPRVQGKDGVK